MNNNNDDIRSFLTNGSRAKVPPRNARLNVQPTRSNSDEEELESKGAKERGSEGAGERGSWGVTGSKGASSPQNSESPAPDFSGLEAELETLPAIGKRLAIHLERELRADLLRWCDEAEVTPETLIEAACAYLKDRPQLREEIAAAAQNRLKQRKRAGSIRRTISMAQKYG